MRMLFVYYVKDDPQKKTKVVEQSCGLSCHELFKQEVPDLDYIEKESIISNATEGLLGGGLMLCRS